jgi:hypothetical protein
MIRLPLKWAGSFESVNKSGVLICVDDKVDVVSRAVALQEQLLQYVVVVVDSLLKDKTAFCSARESVCVFWRNAELTPHPRHGLQFIQQEFGPESLSERLAKIQTSAQAWTPSAQTLSAWTELSKLACDFACDSACDSAFSAKSTVQQHHDPLIVTRYSTCSLFLAFLDRAHKLNPIVNVPAVFYNDAKVMRQVVQRSPWHLEFASDDVRQSTEVVLAAVSAMGTALQFACDSPRNNRVVVLAAVRQDGAALRYASAALQQDREVVQAAVSSKGSALRLTEAQFKDDFDIVLAAVSQSGFALEHASLALRDNECIVAAATKSAARSLCYASPRLKKMPRLIIAACKHAAEGFCNYGLLDSTPEFSENRDLALEALRATGGRAYRFLKHPWFQTDAAFVLEAVKLCGKALREAAPHFQDNDEIVLAAVRNDGFAAEFASTRLRKDKAVALAACATHGMALSYFDKKLQDDKDLVLAAIPTYGNILIWVADKSLCNDEDVVQEAVKWHGNMIKFASQRLQRSKTILCSSTMAPTDYLPDEYADDFDVVIASVKRGGHDILCKASLAMRSNKEVVVAAVSKFGKQLAHASAALKADPEVVLASVKSDCTAIRFADWCIYKNHWHIVVEALESSPSAFQADKHRMLKVLGQIMRHFNATPFAASKVFDMSIVQLVHLEQ